MKQGLDSHLISLNTTNDKINDLDNRIITEMIITIQELAQKIGKSEPAIYRHIEQLMKKHLVIRMESRKAGYWEVVE